MTKLQAAFQEQVGRTPGHDIIQSWGQQTEATTDAAEGETDKKVKHRFSTIKNKATVIVLFTQSTSESDTFQIVCLVFVYVCVS